MTSEFDALTLVYALPLIFVWTAYLWWQRSRDRTNLELAEQSREAGLAEPPSLHPFINPYRCLGCGTCVSACPESGVLGLIDGRAHLLTAANCVGHGACKDACPHEAITLVLGTARRGVEIPVLDSEFQTGVPGLYVAGELGGMGLIRNAILQGRLVMDSIRANAEPVANGAEYDVIVIGAGPAGFSATLAARQHGLRCLTLEQEALGGAVAHYPRRKLVLTSPVELPGVGWIRMRETTKEALLALWRDVEERSQLGIHYQERVEEIKKQGDVFVVSTNRGVHRSRFVVLAIGRRGTPRKLQVRGEDLPKVVYRLVDPEQYRGQHVLVVGGGDSALEAAASVAEEPGTAVTLSYRSAAFSRAKPTNRDRLEAARESGRLRVLLQSTVREVMTDGVRLRIGEEIEAIRNDAVIVCAGGVLPSAFLHSIGIETRSLCGESPLSSSPAGRAAGGRADRARQWCAR
jgi:thioredoxin reductase/ferredoxin